jgi:hypothetical protein
VERREVDVVLRMPPFRVLATSFAALVFAVAVLALAVTGNTGVLEWAGVGGRLFVGAGSVVMISAIAWLVASNLYHRFALVSARGSDEIFAVYPLGFSRFGASKRLRGDLRGVQLEAFPDGKSTRLRISAPEAGSFEISVGSTAVDAESETEFENWVARHGL